MNDGLDDDYDNYQFELSDGQTTYYTMVNQQNEIVIPNLDSHSVPRVGENFVTVRSNDKAFVDSEREFFTLPAQQTNIEVPLISNLKDGELAVVLTWTEGVSIQGTKVQVQNLDLHVQF